MKFMMAIRLARAEGTEWINEGALAALGENSKKYFWYHPTHLLIGEFQSEKLIYVSIHRRSEPSSEHQLIS